MLCVVPLLRALRAKFPSSEIDLVASPVNFEVMHGNRFVSNVLNFDKREILFRGRLHPGKFRELVTSLRRREYDLALVPSTVSTSFTSDFLAYLSGAPMRIGVGSIDGKENPSSYFFNAPVDLAWSAVPHRHQTLRNLDLVRDLEVRTGDLSLELTLNPIELIQGKLFYDRNLGQGIIGIGYHPGAGKVPNRWPAERFASVANVLSDEFSAMAFVTAGSMDDKPLEGMEKGLNVPHYVLRNQPIRLVASILKNLHLVITNDTGIMHVAAAAGTPVLSLFGPTDPEQWAPIGTRHRYIYGGGGRIDSITVEEVLRYAREMLRESGE
jgi:heptosyltransferase-2